MIRPATLNDVSAILSVSTALAIDYPLRADKDRMKAVIIEVISSRSHFAMVDVHNGIVRSVLLAMVGDNLWAQRKFANVMLWWSDKPGSGVNLLRRFKKWVVSRRAIRIAGFAPDIDLEERTLAIFEHLGFRKSGGAYLFVNGVIHGTV